MTALRMVMSHSNKTAEHNYLQEDPAVLGETACRVIEAARRRALQTGGSAEENERSSSRERAVETLDDERERNAGTETAKVETETGQKTGKKCRYR